MTETIPALLDHCVRVYEAMAAEATEEPDGEITDMALAEGKTLPTATVWEGHTTKIFAQLGLAAPYYTAVMTKLKEMGCMEQVRRGGGSASSKWILLQEPSLALFEGAIEASKPTTMARRVTNLEKEVATLRHNLNVVLNHLGVKL